MVSFARASLHPRRVFYGWWIVSTGFTLQLLNNSLLNQAFGAYFVHLQKEFGWSRTAVSASYSILQVVAGTVGPIQGKLVDKLGSRTVIRIGLVALAAGFVALSFVNSLLAFYGVFLVLSFGSAFAAWIPFSVAAANWFRRRRALAMGIIGAGGNVAGMCIPLVAWSLARFGWRDTALASAAIIVTVCLPLSHIIRSRPEDMGMRPDGAPVPPSRTTPAGAQRETAAMASDESGDLTVSQAAHTSAFWLIGIGHSSAVLLVAAVNVHLISHLVQRLHMSVQQASIMLALMTGFCILGQVLGGIAGDKVEKRFLAAVGMVGHILGLLALAFATNVLWVVAFAALHGTAWGLRGPLMSAIRADYFGSKHLGSILGYSMIMLAGAQLIGPLLVGYLADRTGDYRLGFVIIGIVGAVGGLAFLIVRKPASLVQAATKAP